jgi:hypothetical protein
MWEKLKIRERERTLGILFAGVALAIFIYVLLGSISAIIARVGLAVAAGILCLFAVRLYVLRWRSRGGRTPVGPLSPDERTKARSKLLHQKATTQPKP